MTTVYTGVYDDTAAVDDLPEGIECPDCGFLYWGYECDTCWPDPLDFR